MSLEPLNPIESPKTQQQDEPKNPALTHMEACSIKSTVSAAAANSALAPATLAQGLIAAFELINRATESRPSVPQTE